MSNEKRSADALAGNILLFYAFDIGDEVSFETIAEKGLVPIVTTSASPVFKHYRAPLSFNLRERDEEECAYTSHSVFNKVYDFGVLSLCYMVPFEGTFESLKMELSDIKRAFDSKSAHDAATVFADIKPALASPSFFNIKNSYFAIQVNPEQQYANPAEFKQRYAPNIASLLRLEKQNLSAYQKDEILSSATGYYGEDLIIIDSDAAFIYDHEYFEALEFIEAALIEHLELEYFDRVLDKQLRQHYLHETLKVPLLAYIPLVSKWVEQPMSRLTRLRVDVLVITDRLKNSVKISGDAYYSRLYEMLVGKLLLKEWRESINKKLAIFKDIYTVYQDRLDTIHEEMLTVVIIILIAMEAFVLIK